MLNSISIFSPRFCTSITNKLLLQSHPQTPWSQTIHDLGDHASQNLDLLQHTGLARATLGSPHLDALLVVKRLGNILLEPGVHALHLLVRELIHGGARLLAERHTAAADVVGLPERHALAHQVVSHIRRQHEGVERGTHLVRLRGQR